jgi:hypothetical protein
MTMTSQDKIILEDLLTQVKNGTLDVNDLPLKWKEKVEQELEREEGE